MDGREKVNDNVKSRIDVVGICDIEELHLQLGRSGKTVKPKEKLVLPMEKEKSCVNGSRDFKYLMDIALI